MSDARLAALTPTFNDQTKLILVGEDDDALAILLEELICDELNCEIVRATDGKQTLELAHTVRVDLILLDYLLPEMDGLQVYDALQADPQTRTIPVLFVTAAANNPAFTDRGLTNYIQKPFDIEDFIEQVRSLLYPV